MKTFIVLIAVVAVASANTLNRAAGWGSHGNLPSINIDLGAGAAAIAAGQASAGQALIETAVGDINGNAYLQSLSGVVALVSQDEQINQMASIDKPSGATSSINVADVNNLALGEDMLYGAMGGSIGASASNAAQAQATGEGSEAAEATSLIDVVSDRK